MIEATSQIVPTLLLTGPPGAGKTTIGAEISTLLHDPPVPHAFIDLDMLSWCFPPPRNDRFQQKLALRNLRDVWKNDATAGATHLVIARVLESRDELEGYAWAVPKAAITVIRLSAPIDILQDRLWHRYSGLGAARDATWHVERAAELAPLMEKEAVEDLLVETDGRTPREIAQEIIASCGWPRF
ncbi:MAG: hypothetical protein EXR58_05690 [Chloroflexi bacterium]|nr:hypothetical protein [Chloroflexota bacterium]